MNFKSKHILTFCIGLCAFPIFAHDVPVHWGITFNAAKVAHDHSFAYASFFDTISSDMSIAAATNFIRIGSGKEDDPTGNQSPDPNDGGGYRSLNHFYDPLYSAYGRGLSDVPPDRRDVAGTNSFAWASISNSAGFNYSGFLDFIGRNENTSNKWSWQNARGYEWIGLTASNQKDRITGLTNMFRSVGQVMHLLEDTSQPQHVRNEQHVDKLGKIGWESPIEDWGNANVTNVNYGDGSMLDWRGAGFTKLEDFWDRHLYAPGSAAVLQDAETGGAQLGLAEWCNGNFLGDRHLFPEYYNPGDIEYYPYPSRNHSTDYNTVRANPSSGLHPLASANGPGNGIYLHKTTDGVDIQYLSRVNFLGAKHPNVALKGVPYCTIRDDNVLSNYHNVFIPKAVKYSAGLIDYFFRGTFSVNVSGNGSGTNTITILNDSGQTFHGGTFFLYKDDQDGFRTLIQQNDLNGNLANGGTTVLTAAPDISVPTTYILVYRGTIGIDPQSPDYKPLDPVDAEISIAATSFTLDPVAGCTDCDCTLHPENPASSKILGWHSGTGSGISAHDSSITFSISGGHSTITTRITNPSNCDRNLQFIGDDEFTTIENFRRTGTISVNGSNVESLVRDNGGSEGVSFAVYLLPHSEQDITLDFYTSAPLFKGELTCTFVNIH